MRDDVLPRAASIPGLTLSVAGVRDRGPHVAMLALSAWHDREAVEAATDRFGPTTAFAPIAPPVEFAAPEDFEVVGDANLPVPEIRDGAICLVRFRTRPGIESGALGLVRRMRAGLAAEGSVGALLVGRRVIGTETEAVAATVWHDRERMGRFLAGQPESPGLGRRFARLAREVRIETFDVLDVARPTLGTGAPAVLVLDADRIVVDATSGIEPLLGVPAGSLPGRRLEDLLAGTDRRGLAERWQAMLRSGGDEAVVEMRHGDGTAIALRHRSLANVPAPGLQAVLVERIGVPTPEDLVEIVRRALGDRLLPRPGEARDDISRPQLVTLPGTDRLFQRFVGMALEALGTPSMRRLQLHLRSLYPHAVVRRREIAGEPRPTWYVLRDGRAGVPPLRSGWADEPAAGCAELSRNGRITDADERFATLLGIPPGEARGADLRTLGVPGSFDDLGLLLRLAWDEGVSESSLRLLTRAGAPLELAFRAERHGARLRTWIASAPDDVAHGDWFAPICLPSRDARFIARVEDLCARLRPRDAETFAQELEVRLRVPYPAAVVQPLGHVAGFGPHTSVLLVYRDGDRSPFAPERWWQDPEAAAVTIAGGAFRDANDAAAGLLGISTAELVDSPVARYATADDDRLLLLDILQRTGTLHTTTIVLRGDGQTIDVELRAEVLSTHPLTVRMVLRPSAPSPSARPPGGIVSGDPPSGRPRLCL